MNELPKRSGRKIGVTTIIYAALTLIVVFHLLSSLPSLCHAYRTYQQADMVYRLNEVSDDLYAAVNNLGLSGAVSMLSCSMLDPWLTWKKQELHCSPAGRRRCCFVTGLWQVGCNQACRSQPADR